MPFVFSRVFTSPGGTASMRSTEPDRRAATRAASLAMNLMVTFSKAGFLPQNLSFRTSVMWSPGTHSFTL